MHYENQGNARSTGSLPELPLNRKVTHSGNTNTLTMINENNAYVSHNNPGGYQHHPPNNTNQANVTAYVNPSPRNQQILKQSSQASIASQSTPYKPSAASSSQQHYTLNNNSPNGGVSLTMNHIQAPHTGISSSQSSPLSPQSIGSNHSTTSLPLASSTASAGNSSNRNINANVNPLTNSNSKLTLPNTNTNNVNSNSTGNINNSTSNTNSNQLAMSTSTGNIFPSTNNATVPSSSVRHSVAGIRPTSAVHSSSSISSQTLTTSISTSQIPTLAMIPELQQRYIEIGLENLGNTCFMNSILQCLVHIPSLLTYFLVNTAQMERDLNPKSPTKGILAKSFHQLLQQMVYGKPVNQQQQQAANNSTNVIAPLEFQRAVRYFLF